MPKRTISHGELSWTRRSKKEASAARDATLDALLTHEGFAPLVLFCPVKRDEAPGTRGVVLVRRSLSETPSWWYEFVRPLEPTVPMAQPGMSVVGGSCGSWDTREECVKHARRHLAQSAYDLDGVDAESELWIASRDDEGLSEHRRWVAWQQRYAAARAAGSSDDESWHIASRG